MGKKKKKKGIFCPNYPLSLADTVNWSRIFLRKPHFSVTKGIQFQLTKLPAAAFKSGYYLQLMPGNKPLIPSVSFLVTWSKTYPIYLQKRRESNSVQFSHSVMSNSLWSHGLHHSRTGFPVHHELPEHAQTYVHWVSHALQPSHPLLSLSPPAFNLSQQIVFSNESVLCIRWPNYWSFSFSISPSKE